MPPPAKNCRLRVSSLRILTATSIRLAFAGRLHPLGPAKDAPFRSVAGVLMVRAGFEPAACLRVCDGPRNRFLRPRVPTTPPNHAGLTPARGNLPYCRSLSAVNAFCASIFQLWPQDISPANGSGSCDAAYCQRWPNHATGSHRCRTGGVSVSGGTNKTGHVQGNYVSTTSPSASITGSGCHSLRLLSCVMACGLRLSILGPASSSSSTVCSPRPISGAMVRIRKVAAR